MSEIDDLKRLIRSLFEAASSGSLDERELVTLFFQEGFFSVLGYGRVGEDIRLEQRTLKGRIDVTLRAFAARPVAVIEFKAPGVSLAGFIEQLSGYTAEVFPEVGILTNGIDLWLFKCHGGLLSQTAVEQMTLGNLTTRQAQLLYDSLRLRHVDIRSLADVNRCLSELRGSPLAVNGPAEAGGKQFLSRFALKKTTPFGILVSKLLEALPYFRESSEFTKGAYQFWRHIYSRELDIEESPASWRVFVQSGGRDAMYQFMFSLETAYAILSRVMLAKAMQVNHFPYMDVVQSYSRAIEARHSRGVLSSSAHVNAVASVFTEAGRQAFTPLFASDIFDWWQDDASLSEDGDFGYALAEAALAVFSFDFSPLRGDILGNLYQSYFDPETRLALGEFYTPPEVVDFILDEVGYAGPSVTISRLLDPACGSGTFLVHALNRYLAASQGQEPGDVLRGLIGGLRIVGFDINPFACLMAQVNYAAQILPLYSQALQRNPHLFIPGIPVLRTDSLRQEAREEELIIGTKQQQIGFRMEFAGDLANIRTTLPVLREGDKRKEVLIAVPRFDRARERGLVSNVEEYFAVLRQMFLAIKQGQTTRQEIERHLSSVLSAGVGELTTFLLEAVSINVDTMNDLRREYGDGRFHKTLEDTALAMVLKNELQYHFVVMNPPYVRIQRIPEMFRRLWQSMYNWSEGNYDIFVPFIQRSVEGWLQLGGKLGFICSNRFLLANYASPLRRLLPAQAKVRKLLDLRDTKVFEKALNYPAICVVEKGAPSEPYVVPSGRAFAAPPSGTTGPLLKEAKRLMDKTEDGHPHRVGTYVDAFALDSRYLSESAWLLMPASERVVFDALAEVASHRLEELTLTSSGGFQGYSTSLDDILVLRAEREIGDTVRLLPRGGGDPVDIERELLRPWLFGKDVERWHIDWAGWYVIFPYVQIGGKYKLIPCREYGSQSVHGRKVPFIEDFARVWQYLTRHENALRRRENGRFLKGRREENLWYGATYPRSIDLYHLSKILVQVSSTAPDMAFDDKGKFVFTAGGTSGVYGIRPNPRKLDPWFALALLNSSAFDFYLKHVSTVYEGSSYSYGDQFIKQLPIKLPRTSSEKEIATRLAFLANDLTVTKGDLRHLEGDMTAFPFPQATTLGSQIELYPLNRLVSGEPGAQTIDPRDYSVCQALDGQWGLRLGRATLFFATQAHVQIVEKWLSFQSRNRIPSSALMALKLPSSEDGCRLVLDALVHTEDSIVSLSSRVKNGESEVDELVAKLYHLTPRHMKVIADFLGRF